MATDTQPTIGTQPGNPPNPRQNFEPAPLPAGQAAAETPDAKIQEAFVADRQMFWSRFTTFTAGAVVAVVLLLIAMAVFLV